jgi:hypothetical protein
MVNEGLNYTIISGNTYIGSWTSSDVLTWSLGFTCVHNSNNDSVICGEETSNNGHLGYVTKQMVYDSIPGDFLTASVVDGKDLLAATSEAPSATATLARTGITASGATATATPTGSLVSPQSTGAASRSALDGSIAIALAGAALAAMW